MNALFRCLLFLLLQKNTYANTQPIQICGVPGPGAYMMYNTNDGSSSVQLLETYLNNNSMIASKSFTASQIGAKGIKNNPNEAITGFNADTLSLVMAKAGLPNYVLKFYNSYSTSLIHLRTGECDVTYGQYTHTAFRQHCGNATDLSDVACELLPNTNKLMHNIKKDDFLSYACCDTVGLPIFATTLGLLVTAHNEAPSIATFLFQPEVINIIALVTVAIVVAAHFIWFFERHDNSDQFPTAYFDGIDDAIWWSSTTVTTVGYGDKSPVTSGGRIVGLVWQFAGVVFLGLFAGTLSASMTRVATDRGITHISDLNGAHKVCTYSLYLEKLRVYPFASYTVDYKQCLTDLKEGKCDAVYYDELFLKHEFVIDDSMAKKYKVVPGDDIQFVGPYYPSFGSLTIQRKMNAALTALRKDGSTFRNGVKIYYPNADGAGQDLSSTPTINYGLCLVALGFIVIYWGICVYMKWNNGELDTFCCFEGCRKIKKVKSEKESSPEDTSDSNTTTGEQVFVKVRKRNSFVQRDIELSNKKKSSHGNLHTLYADGIEFVGLTNEVHSIHGGMDRLESMIATLMKKDEEENEEEEKEEIVFDQHVSSSSEDEVQETSSLP